MLVVIQAAFGWICSAISTTIFLAYNVDQKPQIVSSPSGSVRLSSPLELYPPWTPGRGFISTLCIASSVVLIPTSLLYIIPAFPTTEPYWHTLEVWSFGLNILSAGLAFVQGIPQVTLTGFLLLRQTENSVQPSTEGTNASFQRMELLYYISSALKWFILAGVWTTWFGARLYGNMNFYLPVLWVVGAQVYLNYLVVGLEDIIVAWMLWCGPRAASKGKTGARPTETSTTISVGARNHGPANERTPLLASGMRWHDEGGEQWTSN
ncbi:hypothetical protein H072_2677 [Dactylellina haptotyla CBS 200.50]|uniref:Uncharacterized protein n=1 Tax=Dactylellina haptotyla (strain CBS 200.50) TaxID=1284197 RepID=S8C6S5_DACHA|nr:hypothetical protein H072_2677 [Dactylellina haptotyla CBS 200.50]